MKQVWFIDFGPQELVRFFLRANAAPINKKSVAFSDKPWSDLASGKCAVFWAKNENFALSAPMILVADKKSLDVILPKLMAIPGKLSPVTAFCRVWDKSSATQFTERMRPKLDEVALCGFVGLMIAEILTRHGSELDLRRFGIGMVARLFSHSCAQLLFAGGRESELNRLGLDWLEAAYLTRNEVDKSLVSTLTFLNNFLLSEILDKPSFDGSANRLGDAIDNWGEQQTDLFSNRFIGMQFKTVANDVRSMPRELRFAHIEKLIMDLRRYSGAENQFIIDLQCGYLLSLIDPTSLAFLDMAFNVDDRRGYVACAYAMCTGLLGGSSFLWLGEGFGINVLSSTLYGKDDLLNSHPDVSLDELRLLRNKIGEGGFEFRTEYPSVVQVELQPDVTGSFSNGARRESAGIKSHAALIAKLGNIDELALALKNTLDDIRIDIGSPRTTPTRKRRAKNSE